LRPEAGFIEVGDGNTYAHPVQSILDRLVVANCYIYQTELGAGGTFPSGKGTIANGNLILKTSGANFTVTFGDSIHSYPGDISGSQDTIAPLLPQNPALLAFIDGPIQVRWDHNHADVDMKDYIVYRSTQSGFPLADSTRLLVTTDSSVVDSTASVGETYYYKITSVDFHGNESLPSTEQAASALPIQLSAFYGSVNSENNVVVEWTTISEVNSLGFYVERRNENEQTFHAVSDLIPGAGTSSEEHLYVWMDANTEAGRFYYRLRQIDVESACSYSNEIKIVVTGALAVKEVNMPRGFAIEQNYPNPFNPVTRINYQIPVTAFVTVKVYNVLGQEVAVLVDGQQEPGYKFASFDAAGLASGTYYYRLQAGSYNEVKKMLLLR
jgi:hypothetical protein